MIDPAVLVYCGFLGGNGSDQPAGIAVDSQGNAYLAGLTGGDSPTFPIKVGPSTKYPGGLYAGFVGKVDSTGRNLVYCGYIGGRSATYLNAIAVDSIGCVYVFGSTNSMETSFPVTVGPDLTYNYGGFDGFIAKVALTLLEGSGTNRPGGTMTHYLTATDDAGLFHQLGSSLGTGPIVIGTRLVNLRPDDLLVISVYGLCPWIFQDYQGVIDSQGKDSAQIHIPDLPTLIGLRLHTAFVTLDPAAPSGIKPISNTFSFLITK